MLAHETSPHLLSEIDLGSIDLTIVCDSDFLGLNVFKQSLVSNGPGRSSWEIKITQPVLVGLAKGGWEPELGEAFTIAVVGNQKVVAVAAGGGQATDDGVLFVFDVEVIG